ncbi:hypothetical protein EYE35_01165 [Cereibacter sphaeroides]|nr:hypothetical protein EYE35_01165 [Cereibacter sphaeroides]
MQEAKMADPNDPTTQAPTAEEAAATLPKLAPDVEPTGEPSEDELERLSPAERAALKALDEDDDAGDDDDDDEGLPEGFALTKEEREAIMFADDPPEPVADGTEGVEPAHEEPPAAAAAPVVPDQAMLDAAFKDATEAANAKRAALFDEYEDGEHTREEYRAKLAEIDAGIAAEATANLQRKLQEAQDQAFATSFKDAAIAYLKEVPDLITEEHAEAYDAHVRAVTGDPRYSALSPRQMLELAHRRYLLDQPAVKAAIPTMPGAKKGEAQAEKQAEKQRKKPAPPMTLANIPAAATTEAGGNRWAQFQAAMDKADPRTKEQLLASLSDEDRDAYMAAG